jgi:hypothetical protein
MVTPYLAAVALSSSVRASMLTTYLRVGQFGTACNIYTLKRNVRMIRKNTVLSCFLAQTTTLISACLMMYSTAF